MLCVYGRSVKREHRETGTHSGDAASYQPQQPEDGERNDFKNRFRYVEEEEAVEAVESIQHGGETEYPGRSSMGPRLHKWRKRKRKERIN